MIKLIERHKDSFHSDATYKFHEYAEIYPLMNQKEVENLGKSIKKHGQDRDIVLYEKKILDGRNTYLACRKEGVTPRFRYYEDKLDPLDFVRLRNSDRRHLSSAQRAAVALRFLQIEKKRAKERINQARFRSNTKKNSIKKMASNPGSLAINEEKKGRAIDIVAKENEIAPKTLIKALKIEEASKKDSEIKEKWEKAKRKEISLEEVYRAVKEKQKVNIEKEETGKLPNNGKLWPPVYINGNGFSCSNSTNLSEKTSLTESQLIKKPEEVEVTIRRNIVDTFAKAGKNQLQNCGRLSSVVKTKMKKEGNVDKCKFCEKATLIAIRCEECGHPTPKVICDDDVAKGITRLRKPYLKKCVNSPSDDFGNFI